MSQIIYKKYRCAKCGHEFIVSMDNSLSDDTKSRYKKRGCPKCFYVPCASCKKKEHIDLGFVKKT